ncbi:MAG: PadR family transcriptional regulator [Candidatus Bathyarchaeota archaeon]|nr:MAG: PadR family transcriptional regulator [Candidatus Bathyarchaeota archaeon]
MADTFRKQLVQRFCKSLLDIHILRLIQKEPMWGYEIIKQTEQLLGVKLTHGAVYPLLNSLETRGYLRSRKEVKGRRARKTYEVTSRGIQLIEAYYNYLREQLLKQDIEA